MGEEMSQGLDSSEQNMTKRQKRRLQTRLIMLIRYCDEQIKLGSLSVESVRQEVKQNIIPRCYEEMKKDAIAQNSDNIPTFDKALKMVELSSIFII